MWNAPIDLVIVLSPRTFIETKRKETKLPVTIYPPGLTTDVPFPKRTQKEMKTPLPFVAAMVNRKTCPTFRI